MWGDSRESERYIFDHHTILDSTGKRLSPVDCVLFAPLSTKKDATPLLKTVRYIIVIIILHHVNINVLVLQYQAWW